MTQHDLMLMYPPEEKRDYHRILVTITREYEVYRFGTEYEAIEKAKEDTNFDISLYDEEYKTAEVIEE